MAIPMLTTRNSMGRVGTGCGFRGVVGVWPFTSEPVNVPAKIMPAKAVIIHFGKWNKSMNALATQS